VKLEEGQHILGELRRERGVRHIVVKTLDAPQGDASASVAAREVEDSSFGAVGERAMAHQLKRRAIHR
jgi:hypothetical protein